MVKSSNRGCCCCWGGGVMISTGSIIVCCLCWLLRCLLPSSIDVIYINIRRRPLFGRTVLSQPRDDETTRRRGGLIACRLSSSECRHHIRGLWQQQRRTDRFSGTNSDISKSNKRAYRIPNNIDGMIIDSKSIHATIKYFAGWWSCSAGELFYNSNF
jgi:hypothetical protein